jgi:hypothetical protein
VAAEIGDLADSAPMRELAEAVLGDTAFSVRGILFDKIPEANWKVPWHQDVTIAVRAREDAEGFGPWSTKAAILHVHAPSRSNDFSANQVSSQDPDTGWHTPHAPGIGDALLLEISRPAHIDQVGVIAGCGANETEWLNHARLKDIEVTVNGAYASKSVLPDEFTFPWPESYKAYEWINLPPYPGNAKTIRLIVRSVYSGSSDQVTCIGKVMLRQWLDSRPSAKSGVDGHELP